MIFRLSNNVARRLRVRPTDLHPLNANPYADWSVESIVAKRKRLILVVNTRALYTVLVPADGIVTLETLEARALAYMGQALKEGNLEFFYRRLVERDDEPTTYSRLLNAESEAVLRDLAELATYYLSEEDNSPDEASTRINGDPLAVLDHAAPLASFKNMGF